MVAVADGRRVRQREPPHRQVGVRRAVVAHRDLASALEAPHLADRERRLALLVLDHDLRLALADARSAVVGAEREQRVRVLARRPPVEPPAVAAILQVEHELRRPRVAGVELQQRHQRERRLADVLRVGRAAGDELSRAKRLADADERASEPRPREERKTVADVVERVHPVLLRPPDERKGVAGVDRDVRVRTERPALQQGADLVRRLRVHLHARRRGRLDQEVRGVERDLAVPRRTVAVRPHREVRLAQHRRHAGDAGADDVERVGVASEPEEEREHARGRLLQAAVRILGEEVVGGAELGNGRAARRQREARRRGPCAGVRGHDLRLAGTQHDDVRRLLPRHGRAHRQLDRLRVRLAQPLRAVDDDALSDRGAGDGGEGQRLRVAVGDRDAPLGRAAGERDGAGRRKLVFDLAVRAAAVGERQRQVEAVAGRGETRRVRLHHQLRADLLPRRAAARPAPVVGERRHPHLAHELRQPEVHEPDAVRQRDVELPLAQRTEPPRRHGADAVHHPGEVVAARLDSARLQLRLVQHRQQPAVDVEERMPSAALAREESDRVGRPLVREQVDALVHDGDDRALGDRRVALRDEAHLQLAAALVEAFDRRLDEHRELAVPRADPQRQDPVSAAGKTALRVRRRLHQAHRHVHVRRPRAFQRAELHDLRQVRDLEHPRVERLVAHHRQPGVAAERTLQREPRAFLLAVESLVGRDGHLRRILHGGTELVVAVRRHPERAEVREPTLLVLDDQLVVAAAGKRDLDDAASVGADGDRRGDRHLAADALRVPAVDAILLHEVVDGLDLPERRRKCPRLAVRRPVGVYLDYGEIVLRAGALADIARHVGAEVVWIGVDDAAFARDRRASAGLERRALHDHADGGLGASPLLLHRDGERRLAALVGEDALQARVVRRQPAASVAEAKALPSVRRELGVGEGDERLGGHHLRRAAEQVLRRDREGQVARRDGADRQPLQGDADLRRHELLDLDLALAERDRILAGNLRHDRPLAGRDAVRRRERLARDRAERVRHRGDGLDLLALGVKEAQHDRERLGRVALAVAQDGVDHDRLAVAVDAALRPHHRAALVRREVGGTVPVRQGLADLHRLADRHEGGVGAVRRGHDERERLVARVPSAERRLAVRVRLRRAEDFAAGRVERGDAARQRPAGRERRRPDAEPVLVLPRREADVGQADEAELVVGAPCVVVFVAGRLLPPVAVADRDEVDTIGDDALLHLQRERERLPHVRPVGERNGPCDGQRREVCRRGTVGDDVSIPARKAFLVLLFLASEELDDVLRQDAPDDADGVGDVHAVDEERARADGGEVASSMREAHGRTKIGARLRHDEVLFEREAVVEAQVLLDRDDVGLAELERLAAHADDEDATVVAPVPLRVDAEGDSRDGRADLDGAAQVVVGRTVRELDCDFAEVAVVVVVEADILDDGRPVRRRGRRRLRLGDGVRLRGSHLGELGDVGRRESGEDVAAVLAVEVADAAPGDEQRGRRGDGEQRARGGGDPDGL